MSIPNQKRKSPKSKANVSGSGTGTAGSNPKRLDPLFQLFEHFLMTRSYEDSAAFTKQLAEQYIGYLDSTPAHVPFDRRVHVIEDLTQEAHEMLVKKMYGTVKASDYQNSGVVMRLVEDDFQALEFDPQSVKAQEKPAEKAVPPKR